MLTLKLMSEQDLPDDSTDKDYELVQIADNERLQFLTTSGTYDVYTAKVVAIVKKRDGSEDVYPLVGNAYVMNANGKTIASRSPYGPCMPAPLPPG
jgi:hypothetical protein